MFKTRQRQIRLFAFEDEINENNLQKFIDFISKNLPLLQRHTLGFSEIPEALRAFLESHNLSFLHITKNEIFLPRVIEEVAQVDKDSFERFKKFEKLESQQLDLRFQRIISRDTKMISRVIRSGEEIYNEGDTIITQKINSGAKLRIKGNAVLLDECSGNVEINGEFLIFQKIFAPALLFGGKLFDKTTLESFNQKDALFKILFKENNDISLKELK